MKSLHKIIIVVLLCVAFSATVPVWADDFNGDEIFLKNDTYLSLLQQLRGFYPAKSSRSYTVLDIDEYKKTVAASRKKVQQILQAMRTHRNQTNDEQIAFIVKQLLNSPYLF